MELPEGGRDFWGECGLGGCGGCGCSETLNYAVHFQVILYMDDTSIIGV